MKETSLSPSYDAFVSYAGENKPVADAVCALLESRRIRCWIAPRDILPGRNYSGAILEGIRGSRVLVLIFSGSTNRSPHVLREVQNAVECGLSILTMRIEDVPPSDDLRYFLGMPHWLDALTEPREAQIHRLADTIEALLNRARTSSRPPVQDRVIESVGPPPMTAAEYPPEHWLGKRFGSFVAQKFIGRGGSGLVFRAFQREMGTVACVKLLFAPPAGQEVLNAALRRGVRGLSSLHHPNVIRIKDFGPVDGVLNSFYLIMDYVEGQPLDDWSRDLNEAPDAWPIRLRLARKLADALQSVHEARFLDEMGFETSGLFHGDLKPSNILVRADGEPIILDFMMADVQRLLNPPQDNDDRQYYTTSFGTPGFMSPEQDKQGIVNPRTDIYSLGLTFGSLFCPNTNAPIMAAIQKYYGAGLGPLLLSMIETNPADRPPSMAAVAASIADITQKSQIRI